MAAELEVQTDKSAKLLVSSGGVFEVEYEGKLIFSKKALGRFPDEGEVVRILYGVEKGLPLDQAQKEASADVPHNPSFAQWLTDLVRRRR